MLSTRHRAFFCIPLAVSIAAAAPAASGAAGVKITDLGAVSGPSGYAALKVRLQGPYAVHRFSAAQPGFAGQFSEADTCGGNAGIRFIDNARFEITAARPVTCRVTVSGSRSSAVLATVVAFSPLTVSPGSLTVTAGAPQRSFSSYQPGTAIGVSPSCSMPQALGFANLANGELLVSPNANARCTITFIGTGSTRAVPVSIQVPDPTVADFAPLFGASAFTASSMAKVTLWSADAERAVQFFEPGFGAFGGGVVPGGCSNSRGETVAVARGFGPGLNQVSLVAGNNGTCHLYAHGFGGIQEPYDVVVAVPPPVAVPNALTFSGPNQIAHIQFGEAGATPGSIGIDASNCAKIAIFYGDG